MTFIHLLSLGALTFGPIYIIYNKTRLATSNNSYYNVSYGFIAYAITLFIKMLLIATFTPSDLVENNLSVVADVTIRPVNGWNTSFVIYEVVKTVLNMSDFMALYLLFNRVKLLGSDDSKVLGIGLGWSFAENVLSRAIPLFVGTISHGLEFDWTWVRLAVHANISMYLYLTLATAVYLFTRLEKNSIDRSRKLFVGLLSFTSIVIPLISQVLSHLITRDDDPTISLIIYFVLTAINGFLVYNTYLNHVYKKQK
jgi:uncharacterized membrane protein